MWLTLLSVIHLSMTSMTSSAGSGSQTKSASASADDGGANGASSRPAGSDESTAEMQDLALDVYDLIKDIRDPEKPNTLEELDVVFEKGVRVYPMEYCPDGYVICVEFTPTVPHCSLATLIGLCIRVKLDRSLPHKHKLDISISKGTHLTGEEITKQINDKERITAAMENPDLKSLVEKCIAEE